MKFYEFGSETAPVLLLLPGTCCHWRANFRAAILLLEQDFQIVCVSYDGFDETERTVFPDMLTETQKIERYIQTACGGRIHAAYGCSLGGSFVGMLVQRRKIHIDHAVLGSSDLDQESIRNQFYSDLVTPLAEHISAPSTTVHCFFAARTGEEYLRRYRQHFRNPDIRRHEMQHEELLICYPERWAAEIKSCCGLGRVDP